MKRALIIILGLTVASGCAGGIEGSEDEGHDHEPPSEDIVYGENAVTDLTPHSATGYKSGTPFAIQVVTVDGKEVQVGTAHQFLRMRAEASRAGVSIIVVSGFRTNAKQAELYRAYQNGTGNLAARPGYSNHQSGHALDLNASASGVLSWLNNNGARWGFKRTVPSENWHWEYWGADPGPPGGSAPGMTPAPRGGGACNSATLAKMVNDGTCVQSASDKAWYHCDSGSWVAGKTGCTASYGWCNSATLGRDVAPRTCVQARSDRIWYQCTNAGWESPVSNGAGKLGSCSSMYEL